MQRPDGRRCTEHPIRARPGAVERPRHAPDHLLATQGHDHIEGKRIRQLLEPLGAEAYPFARAHKARSGLGLLRLALQHRPQLFVMEGTGLAGRPPADRGPTRSR